MRKAATLCDLAVNFFIVPPVILAPAGLLLLKCLATISIRPWPHHWPTRNRANLLKGIVVLMFPSRGQFNTVEDREADRQATPDNIRPCKAQALRRVRQADQLLRLHADMDRPASLRLLSSHRTHLPKNKRPSNPIHWIESDGLKLALPQR
jgi:hypothetical protein